MNRINIVCGHYGSGKTEFSLNYAVWLKRQGKETALIDLDIANVYFRSRELRKFLNEKGIEIYGSAFDHDITAELPALSSKIRKPLEDESCFTVIDVGGNQRGAIILNQFTKYFSSGRFNMYCIINANRPETDSIDGCLHHINEIELATGLKVTGLVNNTHMLNSTSVEDIERGEALCMNLSELLSVNFVYNCYSLGILKEEDVLSASVSSNAKLFPMELFMRPSWLDR